jgi:uncharacterized membrane protein YccC
MSFIKNTAIISQIASKNARLQSFLDGKASFIKKSLSAGEDAHVRAVNAITEMKRRNSLFGKNELKAAISEVLEKTKEQAVEEVCEQWVVLAKAVNEETHKKAIAMKAKYADIIASQFKGIEEIGNAAGITLPEKAEKTDSKKVEAVLEEVVA